MGEEQNAYLIEEEVREWVVRSEERRDRLPLDIAMGTEPQIKKDGEGERLFQLRIMNAELSQNRVLRNQSF